MLLLALPFDGRAGFGMPPLDEVWRLYLRRFTIDHWYRFLTQRLHSFGKSVINSAVLGRFSFFSLNSS